MRATVLGVSVWGPGLPGWAESREVLAGDMPWSAGETPPPIPVLLGPAERRRASATVRVALEVAQKASEMAGIPPGAIPSVFATSNGDGVLLASLLETLADDAAPVSPTQFHNSVHNAAAGYWSIATRSRQPFTCLACHDASFAAALLKAVAQVTVECRPVLLAVYDTPLLPPLAAKRRTEATFGLGLVLGSTGEGRRADEIAVVYDPAAAAPPAGAPRQATLRTLANANPAARGLRLLEALASGTDDDFTLALLDSSLRVAVRPCSTAPAFSR